MRAIVRFSQSSSFRVGALFTGLLLLSVLFVGNFMMFASDETLLRESEAAIQADIGAFRDAEVMLDMDYVKRLLNSRIHDPNNSFLYALRTANGDMIMANLPFWPTHVEPLTAGTFAFEVSQQTLPFDVHTARPKDEQLKILAKVHTFQSGHQLLVGRDVEDLKIAQYVAQMFGWLMIGILVIVAGSSMWVGFYVVSRINRMAETADDIIETGNLSTRLEIDSNWDDLSKLSMALNRMLDEIESLVKGVKSVSDNIAHDLRTPLTRLRGDIDRVDQAETRDQLIKEVDNILAIFNGLLRIADVESEKQKRGFSQHDLAPIVDDVAELYGPLAEHKSISLHINTSPCSIQCDRDMMFQAFANLVDNAIKFTPNGGRIWLSLSHIGNDCVFEVIDSGIGIADKHKERVTQRFYRVDKSRTAAGNGLGMALVAAIAKLHGAELTLKDVNPDNAQLPGLSCQIHFKCSTC